MSQRPPFHIGDTVNILEDGMEGLTGVVVEVYKSSACRTSHFGPNYKINNPEYYVELKLSYKGKGLIEGFWADWLELITFRPEPMSSDAYNEIIAAQDIYHDI